MNLSNKNGWCLFFLLLCCSACIKEINFDLGKQEDQLVVYGIFSDQPGQRLIRVTRTNAFERQVDADPVSGATLFVMDSKSQKHPFVEKEPGTYLFVDSLLRADAGERYYLDIVIPNEGHYRSDIEVMPAPMRMDSVYPGVKVTGNDESLLVFADVPIPGNPEGVYLRWDVMRVWRRTSIDFGLLFGDYFRFRAPVICYMTEDPELNSIRLFGSKRRDAFTLRRQEVVEVEIDDKFFERNAFAVIQYRISAKAYDYWNSLYKVGNPGGNIFDVPPASVRGNIYNVDKPQERILGYFEVAAVDTAYTATERSIFSNYISDPCLNDPSNSAWKATYYFHPECAYCTNIKGYSTVVPKFW